MCEIYLCKLFPFCHSTIKFYTLNMYYEHSPLIQFSVMHSYMLWIVSLMHPQIANLLIREQSLTTIKQYFYAHDKSM